MISEQVSSSEKLSDKIDIAFILQETEIVHLYHLIRFDYCYNERVLNAFKNFLFIFYVIYMLALYDVCLLHALDCILLVNLSLDPAHSYVTKSTYGPYQVRCDSYLHQEKRRK
jgi:hypothetical protein